MSHSRIPSPARSLGAPVTPHRYKSRTRSVGSPARSTTSGRLSELIQFKENNKDSFAISPAPSRRSVLNDDTDIEEPRRRSWWKQLADNSKDVMEVLNDNKVLETNEAVEEYIDIEVLSQEKKNYSIDIPESSDSESISSIVIPQRKLFTQKDQAQNKFNQLIGTRETLAKLHKSHVADKIVNVAPKNLFGQGKKTRSKPVFPAALLNLSPNKTVNKTKENVAAEVKGQVRTLFGNRAGTKRKNMFADFIVSESEDEISEIQPKVFGFPKKADTRRDSANSRGKREHSPTSSVTTDIEMDDWKMLPSSTMVENQLEDLMTVKTPVKRARLSKLSETKNLKTRTTAAPIQKEPPNEEEELKYDNDVEDKGEPNEQNQEQIMLDQHELEQVEDEANQIEKEASDEEQELKYDDDDEVESEQLMLDQNEFEEMRDEDNDEQNNIQLQNNKSKHTEAKDMAMKKLKQECVQNKSHGHLQNISKGQVQNLSRNEIEAVKVSEVEKNEKGPQEQDEQAQEESESKIDEREIDAEDPEESDKDAQNESENKSEAYEHNDDSDEHEIAMEDQEENEEHDGSKHECEVNDQKEIEDNSHDQSDAEAQNASLAKAQNKSTAKMHKSKLETENDKVHQSEPAEFEDDNIQNDIKVKNKDYEPDEIEEKEEIEDDDQNESTDMQDKMEEEAQNESHKIKEEMEDEDQNESGEIHKETEHDEQNESAEIQDDQNESPEIQDQMKEDVQNESHKIEEEMEKDDQNESGDIQKETEDDEQNESAEIQKEMTDDEQEESAVQEEIEDDEQSKSAEIQEEMDDDEQDESAVQEEIEDDESVVQEEMEDDEQDESAAQEQMEDDEQDESAVQELMEDDEQDESAVQEEMEDDEQNESAVQEEMEDNEQNDSAEIQEEMEDEQNESTEIQENTEDDEQNQTADTHDEMEEDVQNESQDAKEKSEDEIQDSNDQQESDSEQKQSDETHDTTGRYRKKNVTEVHSPEAILHDKTNQLESFTAQGRNTSIRKTTMLKNLNIRPSLAPPRESTGLSDGTRNSSVEGSGWDSHRTTRKTLRQTFGRDFTPRKSLRALVMEKSAKRQTAVNETTSVTAKFPQANSTELPEASMAPDDTEIAEVSTHEVSKRTRQTTLEMYLQKIKKQNMERKLKMEEAVRNSLRAPTIDVLNPFKVPSKPIFSSRKPNKVASKPKAKHLKSTLIPLEDLPAEVIEDMKYKPPKRFQPSNASWITKRLYKFLETKLESKYDYKARVRAEKLVETIYHFAKDLRRVEVAPSAAVDALKQEMARLDVVKTHFDFYQFFHEYMPREIRVKVVPDVVNKINMPRHGVFSDIIRENTVQG